MCALVTGIQTCALPILAAPGAQAAAFDPCLEAIAEGPRRWRDGVARAAKARRAETKRVGPAPDCQMRQHQRIDLLKVTRAIGKIDRDAVDQQRHPAQDRKSVV